MAASNLKVGDVFKIRHDGGLWEVVEDRGTVLSVRSEIGTIRRLRKTTKVIVD